MKISCVTASYVADLLGYPGETDWGLASRTIEQAPMLETIDGMLERLEPAHLDGIELWFPHVSPDRITPVLAGEIRKRLAAKGMVCAACAGGINDPEADPYGAEASFHTALLLETDMIAGHLDAATIPALSRMCARYGVRAAFENGSEKDVAEIRDVIGDGDEWIGANIDVGNMATRGGDPVQAIHELGSQITHVHLKDVPAVGITECVALGAGIVDIAAVLSGLKDVGYDGWLSIEIETSDRDPSAEIVSSAETVRRLWSG